MNPVSDGLRKRPESLRCYVSSTTPFAGSTAVRWRVARGPSTLAGEVSFGTLWSSSGCGPRWRRGETTPAAVWSRWGRQKTTNVLLSGESGEEGEACDRMEKLVTNEGNLRDAAIKSVVDNSETVTASQVALIFVLLLLLLEPVRYHLRTVSAALKRGRNVLFFIFSVQ